MNKSELVESVSAKSSMSIKDCSSAVNSFMAAIRESLAAGENVTLVGFGSFVVRERAARTGHNPRTGQPLEIPAVKVPAFRPGKSLKEEINGGE